MSAPDGFPATRRDVLRLGALAVLSPAALCACSGGDGDGDGDGDGSASLPATVAQARAQVLQAMAAPDITALSIALATPDRIVWSEAFGLVDKASGTPPAAQTRFAIASVSKLFSTAAILVLVDRGRVDLDAPVVKYVPSFRMLSPQYTQVTVRMLLSHSSGFPGTEMRNSTTQVPMTGYARQVADTLAQSRLKHAPGELAVYCNDGFAIAELVVEAVSSKPYVAFVRDEILAPLGMVHSAYTLDLFPEGSYAPGYKGESKQPLECLACYGGGGLYSTPEDMARFAMMLMNRGVFEGRRILSAAAVAEMARDQTATLPFNPVPTFTFGLGWDGVTQAGLEAVGVRTWHKNGGSVFYGSELFVAPDEGLAVFVVGTMGHYDKVRLCEFTLLRALAERRSIAAMPVPLTPAPRPERVPTAQDVGAIVGCYGSNNALLRLAAEPDRTLTLSRDQQGAWRTSEQGLKFRDDGTWSSDGAPLRSLRALVAGGRRYLVSRAPGGYGHYQMQGLSAQEVVPRTPLSAAWQARAGGTWLAVNHHPRAIEPVLVAGLHTVAELPGYLVTREGQVLDATGDDTRARMCLKIPNSAGVDLNDAVVEERAGEEWLRIGSVLHRPLAGVAALVTGANAVEIGAERDGEWRRLPAAASVAIAGAVSWLALDAQLAPAASGASAGTATLPAGYLLVHGAAGAVIGVTVA